MSLREDLRSLVRLSFAALLAASTLHLQTVCQTATQTPGQTTPQMATPTGAASPPLLSPGAAYDQAMTPVEVTHSAISNWSDVETAALAVAMRQAKDACAARAGVVYTGTGLLDFARLCALGQQWPAVLTAATSYIQATSSPQPELARAYGYQVNAHLRMGDHAGALSSALAMLAAVPYTSLTNEAINQTLRFLQLAYTPEAVTLAEARQPILLRLLHQGSASAADPGASPAAPSADTPPLHELYQDGLFLAAMQQYNNQAPASAATVAALEGALPATVPPDEAILLDRERRQYALLGTVLPNIAASASLFSPDETPRINRDFGTATLLFLFPPWCAQCARMTQGILPALFRLGESGIHIYGLLAGDPPPIPAPGSAASPAREPRRSPVRHAHSPPGQSQPSPIPPAAPAEPPTAAEIAHGTPTLVVSPATLAQFGVTDPPMLIATDHAGIIRLLLTAAPENAFAAGSSVDQIAAHIASTWPPPPRP